MLIKRKKIFTSYKLKKITSYKLKKKLQYVKCIFLYINLGSFVSNSHFLKNDSILFYSEFCLKLLIIRSFVLNKVV